MNNQEVKRLMDEVLALRAQNKLLLAQNTDFAQEKDGMLAGNASSNSALEK